MTYRNDRSSDLISVFHRTLNMQLVLVLALSLVKLAASELEADLTASPQQHLEHESGLIVVPTII